MTKQLFLLLQDIKNIIQYTSPPGTLQILLDAHMGIQSFQSHSFQFRKVFDFFIIVSIDYNTTTANKHQRKRPEFQCFARQVYHMCLARIFAPLRARMTLPEVVRCPDGHFRRAIYSLGPYIADYPEQVWLAGIVQGWCPKYVTVALS